MNTNNTAPKALDPHAHRAAEILQLVVLNDPREWSHQPTVSRQQWDVWIGDWPEHDTIIIRRSGETLVVSSGIGSVCLADAMTDADVYEALASLTYRGPLDAPYGLEGHTLLTRAQCMHLADDAGLHVPGV